MSILQQDSLWESWSKLPSGGLPVERASGRQPPADSEQAPESPPETEFCQQLRDLRRKPFHIRASDETAALADTLAGAL